MKKKRQSKAALKREIKSLIEEVNDRMFEYENYAEYGAEINPMFMDMFSDLYNRGLSGVKKTKLGLRITPAFYTRFDGKLKGYEQLEIQRNELLDFLEMDTFSPQAREEYDAVTESKYQTFLMNTSLDESDFTRTEWESMFKAFEILHERRREFGYGDKSADESTRTNRGAANAYRNTYMKLDREQRRTYGDVLEESLQYLKDNGKTITYKSIIDEVERRYGLNR